MQLGKLKYLILLLPDMFLAVVFKAPNLGVVFIFNCADWMYQGYSVVLPGGFPQCVLMHIKVYLVFELFKYAAVFPIPL